MFEAEKQDYEKNGWALFQGVFAKKEMHLLRGLAWKALHLASPSDVQWKNETHPALLFSPKGLEPFSKDPRMQKIAKAFLGPDIRQLNNQFYYRLPGDGDTFAWHQDICFRTPKEDFVGVEEGYLQTAIIVDDWTQDNSPINFVDGSHKQGDLGLVPRDDSESGLRGSLSDEAFDETIPKAKSGDVLVWSVMVVHGSDKNRSDQSRMYYMNGLAKADCVKTDRFPWYMRDGELQK